jgi:UDPglucose 6-dehydrogenase
MRIGIIGLGVVGDACKFGFEKNGHVVQPYDPAKGHNDLSSLEDTEIVYICVPTPMNDDGSCDISIVEQAVQNLCDISYCGVVSIKSTVPPGTTKNFDCPMFREIIFVPEFLRERCAIIDFVELNRLLVVGCKNDDVYELVKDCHGDFPHESIKVTPTQAELIKYCHNCFGALRVTVANEFYELCTSLGEEYVPVKRGLLKSGSLPDQYFDVNSNVRGWSSICWNKDLPALLSLADSLNVDMPIMKQTLEANHLYKSTPFKGTRENY